MQRLFDANTWIDQRINWILPILFVLVVVATCDGWRVIQWIASQI